MTAMPNGFVHVQRETSPTPLTVERWISDSVGELGSKLREEFKKSLAEVEGKVDTRLAEVDLTLKNQCKEVKQSNRSVKDFMALMAKKMGLSEDMPIDSDDEEVRQPPTRVARKD